MWKLPVSVFGRLRKHNTAIARIMFSLICLGLVIAKFIVLKEIDFVSLCLLLLAAISFHPTMIAAVPRFLRHIRIGSLDLGLQDPDSSPVQAGLAEVQHKLASSSVPDPPALVAATPGDICDIVRTKQLVLHDDNCERARMFVGQNGAVALELCDSSGERRATFWVSKRGVGGITMADENGVWRVAIRGTNEPLAIYDSNNVARTAVIIDEDEAFLAVMGSNGQICSLVTGDAKGGRVQVHSIDQKSTAGLAAIDGYPGRLGLLDQSGAVSTTIAADFAKVFERAFDRSTDSG